MSTVPASDPMARFRDRFPALTEVVHLASCSQGALSTDLSSALFELQHTMRAHGAPWERWTGEVERARTAFAHHINAHPREVAVLSCASEGAYQVASSQEWRRRPKVITSDMEFPSIAHVWLAQQPRGADIVYVPDRDGVITAEDYHAVIDDTVAVVSIPLVSYRNGARLPAREAITAAHEVGAKTFVDGYQACGVLPVDVKALDCDYFVSGTLKYMLGLPGLAFLYVRDGVVDDVAPQLTGWFGQQNQFDFDPRTLQPAPDARRFQTGTPSIPSAYAATAGMKVLASTSPTAINDRVDALVEETEERLLDDGEQLWSPRRPDLRGPMVALIDENPNHLAGYLADRAIATSPRGHVLRLSFHGYNNQADIDTVTEAIRDYRKL